MSMTRSKGALCGFLCLSLAACGPAGAFGKSNNGGGGGGGSPQYSFQIPADGSTVDQVTTLSVTGAGVARAQFEVDGAVVFADLIAPFEWDLDPADFIIGPDNPHVVTVRGISSSGSEDRETVTITLDRAVPLSEIQDAIDNLAPSVWYEIPNSRLAQAGWHDPLKRWGLPGVIEAASGGTYDTKRDRLVVWGGGHDYGGNEIYAFDLATARWIRLTDPSDFPADDPRNAGQAAFHPDGRPVSRHTYDCLEYIPPPVDRLFVPGASIFYGPNPSSDGRTHYFDFDRLAWETTVAEQETFIGPGTCTALGPDGRVWQQNAGSESTAYLSVFDPMTLTWTRHVRFPGHYTLDSVAEIDPVRNLFLTVGNDATFVWDLNNPDQDVQVLQTTGDIEIESVRSGFAYHPPTDRLLAWAGGGAVYVLDVDATEWRRYPSIGSVDPGPAAERGTYGRWRYVPSRDVFIVVNDVARNVFVYRAPEDP